MARLAIGLIVQMLAFCALLFLPAGTWHWARAWLLVGTYGVASVAAVAIMLPKHRGVIEERMKPPLQRDQPRSDKIIAAVLVATLLGAIAMIPVDRFHLHLTREAGPIVNALGLASFLGGFTIMCLAAMQNAFAAAVVRHQKERGHAVVDSGLYGVVRHPMYAGAFLWMLGMPLWLGSYAGVLFFAVPMAVLAVRITTEERFLRRELAGYDAYTRRVRYRLVPFVW